MDDVPIPARLVELELRYMTLERELGELSRVVAAQQRVIDALAAEAKRRREREEAQAEPPIPDERPPHY